MMIVQQGKHGALSDAQCLRDDDADGESSGVRWVTSSRFPQGRAAHGISLLGRAMSLHTVLDDDRAFAPTRLRPDRARALCALQRRIESRIRVDPLALTRWVRERLAQVRRGADIPIYCTCDTLCVDPTSFAQAIFELLDNAVQATRHGHPVVVEIRQTRDGEVLWQVHDFGDGMSAEQLAGLSRPPKAGPVGLGVALAWAVIDHHGGLLRFESMPRIGTTTSIWLPCST